MWCIDLLPIYFINIRVYDLTQNYLEVIQENNIDSRS